MSAIKLASWKTEECFGTFDILMVQCCFLVFLFWYNDLWQRIIIIFQLGFIPCKTEQPLRGMELQEKDAKKD